MNIKNRVLELSNKDFKNILKNKGNTILEQFEEIKSMSKSERLSYYKQMIEAGKMTPNHIRKLEYNLIRGKEN